MVELRAKLLYLKVRLSMSYMAITTSGVSKQISDESFSNFST